MATHLLVVLDIWKITLNRLNSIISSFFWGEVNGKPHMKWCGWKKLCKPAKQGGLELRDFSEVQRHYT